MTTQLYETFGHGEAALDIAREDGEDLLITTESVRAYLRANSGFSFLVGSKGTGKTLLLFRKAKELARNDSVMVIPQPPDKAYRPAPDFSIFLREWADFYRLTDREDRPNLDAWCQVWEASIIQSVLSSWQKHALERGLHQLHSEITGALDAKLTTSNPFDILQDTLTALSLPGASDKGRSLFPRTAHHVKSSSRRPGCCRRRTCSSTTPTTSSSKSPNFGSTAATGVRGRSSRSSC